MKTNQKISNLLKTVLKFVDTKCEDYSIVSDISVYDLVVCMKFIGIINKLSQNSCLKKYDDFKVDISVLDVIVKHVDTIDDLDRILDTVITEKQINTISDMIPYIDTDTEKLNKAINNATKQLELLKDNKLVKEL